MPEFTAAQLSCDLQIRRIWIRLILAYEEYCRRTKLDHAIVIAAANAGGVVSRQASWPAVDILNTVSGLNIALIMTFINVVAAVVDEWNSSAL